MRCRDAAPQQRSVQTVAPCQTGKRPVAPATLPVDQRNGHNRRSVGCYTGRDAGAAGFIDDRLYGDLLSATHNILILTIPSR
jgi:hypothetical protein